MIFIFIIILQTHLKLFTKIIFHASFCSFGQYFRSSNFNYMVYVICISYYCAILQQQFFLVIQPNSNCSLKLALFFPNQVQSGFYRFIAAPLFEEWNRLLSSSLSRQMLNNLTSNQARWDLIIQQETARSASMAESVASQISSSSSSGGGSIVGGSSSRRESLDPHVSHQRLSR